MSFEQKIFFGHFIGRPFLAGELFGRLSSERLKTLQNLKKPRYFEKNRMILTAGDLPPCVYILLKGKARMSFQNRLDNNENSRSVKFDEMLGFGEILADSFCETDVETLTPCTFDCVRRQDFLNFLDDEPEICFQLVRLLSFNLQKSYRNFYRTSF